MMIIIGINDICGYLDEYCKGRDRELLSDTLAETQEIEPRGNLMTESVYLYFLCLD